MWKRLIPCVLSSGLGGALCNGNTPTSGAEELYSKQPSLPQSPNIFQTISNSADFTPYTRPSDEIRQTRGCVGKNFVYNNNDISSQYFWSPARSEMCGNVCWSMRCEGPARHVHGGAIAAALDDAMSAAANVYLEHNNITVQNAINPPSDNTSNVDPAAIIASPDPIKTLDSIEKPLPSLIVLKVVRAVTGTLTMSYKKPVPLNSCQVICARVDKREDRKIYVVAEVSDGRGKTYVEANGIWVIPKKLGS